MRKNDFFSNSKNVQPCLAKFSFVKMRGGAFMLLLTLFCHFNIKAQTCTTLPCPSGIFVQITQDPNFPNISDCPPPIGVPCGGGDQFRQLFFKVKLFAYPTNGVLNFDLNYDKVDIIIEQILAGPPGAVGYSFIDKAATALCHQQNAAANNWTTSGGSGNGLSNGVSFISEEKTTNILFTNDLYPCPDAAGIRFSPTLANDCPPNFNVQFASADLFTVVVNAYPGEVVQLKVVSAVYKASGGDCALPSTNTISGNGMAVNPAVPFNTQNSTLEVRLKDLVQISGGGFNIDVELANLSPTPNTLDIDYLEFVVKVAANQVVTIDIPGAYDRPILPFIAGGTIADQFIQFIVPDLGWTLTSGSTQLVGTITVKPQIANIAWNATVSLLEVNKTRVKTVKSGVKACTSIGLGGPKIFTNPGDVPCGYDNGGVKFTIEGVQTNDCGYPFTQNVKVGFVDTDLSTSEVLVLLGLQFNLDIVTTGTVNLTAVNFPSKGWPNCGLTGCFPLSCHQFVNAPGLIQFSFCRLETSTSFTITPDAFIELVFEGAGCIDAINISSLSLKRNVDPTSCIPAFNAGPYPNIPICMGVIFGVLATEAGAGVEAATVELAAEIGNPLQLPDCNLTVCSNTKFLGVAGVGPSGAYGFCPCAACQYFKITPTRNDNPLNGVTTYDLVLISKHILANPSLNSPYKIIAADANKSASITTLDISLFRRLILGIDSALANNTSWRFVDKAFVFPNPLNPFQTAFPEKIENVDKLAPNPPSQDFVVIKVGDVNNTAIANKPAGEHPKTLLSWPGFRTAPGEVFTMPVTYSGSEALVAVQMGLRFDPNLLQLLSPSLGDLPDWTGTAFNLAYADQGEIRTLWLPADVSDPEQYAKPGNVLFYLTFKVLGELPAFDTPIWLDDALMINAAWRTDGTECSLIRQTKESKRSERSETKNANISASCHPNPSSGALTFSVNSTSAGKGRIALFSPNGVRLLAHDVLFTAGQQGINLPEAAQLPNGVYTWKVFSSGTEAQGHWVKQ